MRKFFSISRKQISILITLLVLAAAGLWYYAEYIPGNEDAINEQHFRWLRKTDENIRAKIIANDTLLSNLLQVYDTSKNKTPVEQYITSYTVTDATLLCSMETAKKKKSSSGKAVKVLDTASTQFDLSWDSSTSKLILSASKQTNGLKYNVRIKYDFDKFIKPLLIPELFNHYVVFYKGNYIYEDFHAGLGYSAKEEDSLLKTGKSMTGANIISQKVGGIDYKIFFQPINFFNNQRLIIAGLLSQKNINKQKKQLPPGYAVLAITIAFGILLFIPWIKIFFQGKYDKITLRDAGESVLVTKLLLSLIILLFFTYNFSYRPKTTDTKSFLANTISNSFLHELNAAYGSVVKLDSTIMHDSLFYDIKNLGKDNAQRARDGNIFGSYDTLHCDTCCFKKIFDSVALLEVNWLDSSGRLKYGWTISKQNNIHANYKDRDYFKNIPGDKDTVSLKATDKTLFAADQIISRTAGSFRTIIRKKSNLDTISKKENRAKVVALSFSVKSLDSVIMPLGYSFAIISGDGDVKYHSKSERNLNENLLEEFSNTDELNDALQGRFKKIFETKYYQGDYEVLVKPIKNTPYFIVVMNDQSLPNSTQIETFSFTCGMAIFFLLVVLFDLFILISASSRRSLFKKQYLVTSWLWPRATSHKEYSIAAIANGILIIELILIRAYFFSFFNYLSYLFVLCFSIPLATIFINSLFLHKYKLLKNEAYLKYKVRCNKYSISLLVFLNVIAIASLNFSQYLCCLFFEIFTVLAGFALMRYHKPVKEKGSKTIKRNYIRDYSLMIFARLIITSALPIAFFYTASYNFENNLMSRYREYDYEQQLENKYPGKLIPLTPAYTNAIYTDNGWIKIVDSVHKKDALCNCSGDHKSITQTDKNTAALFNWFGFYANAASDINNDNFFKPSSADGNYCFNNFFDSSLYANTGNTFCIKRNTNSLQDTAKNHLVIKSANLNYAFPILTTGKGFMFWLLLAITMYAFYILVREMIKKVCSLNLDNIQLSKEINENLKSLITNANEPILWITGLPVDDIEDRVKTQMNAGEFTCLDFSKIKIDDKKNVDLNYKQVSDDTYVLQLKSSDAKTSAWDELKLNITSSDFNYIILTNFERDVDDEKIALEKLNCINSFLEKKKKLIIVANTDPQNISETITGTNAQRLIHFILNTATAITLPLLENESDKAGENKYKYGSKLTHLFVEEETKYTGFLKGLRRFLLLEKPGTETKNFREDKLVLQVQSLAHNFYTGIWDSLSADEKFILYDLAADGLVNISNRVAVSQLINKGLMIEEEGHLYIFNKSFRNYIVSSVNDKEVSHLQLLHKKHSNWSNLQGPLLLVVVAVFVFLAIAQEGLYSKIIGIISGIAAGIPALLKLFSLIGMQNYKPVKSNDQ